MIGKVEYKSHTYTENDDTKGSTEEINSDSKWKTYYYTKFKDWKDDAASSYGNDSVKKYGGFYIARYEAGWEDTETSKLSDNNNYLGSWASETTKKNDNVENKKPISKPNVFAWNFINQENAKTVSESMYGNSSTEGHANSYLVDGTAWDTITNWIAADNVDVTNSTEYGNYLDNGSNYTGWYAKHIIAFHTSTTDLSDHWCCAKYFTNGNIQLHWTTEEHDWTKQEELNCFADLTDHCKTEHRLTPE